MPAPTKVQIKPIVTANFTSKRFKGEKIDALADVIAEVLAQSLTQFMIQVKVAPGIPVTPAATVAPGNLI